MTKVNENITVITIKIQYWPHSDGNIILHNFITLL